MHSQCRESFVQGMQRQIAVRSGQKADISRHCCP